VRHGIAFQRNGWHTVAMSVVLEDLCSIVGYSATRTVAVWFAGKRFYVPRQAYPDHPLRSLLGNAPFEALVAAAADTWFEIPTGARDNHALRDRQIAERLASGAAIAQLVEETGLKSTRLKVIRQRLVEQGWLGYAAGKILERGRFSSDPPSRIGIGSKARGAAVHDLAERRAAAGA
jgi:hypothetical protein